MKTTPSFIFLILAILIGGWMRIYPVAQSPFPINDGGLFYTMTRELQASDWQLPDTTAYNGLGIPFAYPPLGFYLAGFLSELTGWSLLNVFRLLPAILSLLTIPAFYLLARELTTSEFVVSIAVVVFSLLPATFNWTIMGGGITRAPGFLFALLALFNIYRLYTRKECRYIFCTSVLATATVLSHPEPALHTAASALVIWWFFSRNREGVLKSLAVAGLVLLFASPWWVHVLSTGGGSALLAAAATGQHNIGAAFNLLGFNLTAETGLQTMGVLALIGLFITLAQRQLFLPTWFLVIFVSEPRSAPLFLTPLLALFAAIALEAVLRLLADLEGNKRAYATKLSIFESTMPRVAFAVLFAQWTLSSFTLAVIETNTLSLTRADAEAFAWTRGHTPLGSRFLVLTGQQPFTDAISEWFPALTERVSVATVQGQEWDPSKDFQDVLVSSSAVQQCLYRGEACLSDWLSNGGQPFEYVLIRKLSFDSPYRVQTVDVALVGALSASRQYELVYDTREISILIFHCSQ
jgi:hypothetical protein